MLTSPFLAEARRRLQKSNVYQNLLEMDAHLVRSGFPAMSEWWKDTLGKFYAGGRRSLILRVGRRGGKSSTLCRVAVAEALYGNHKIPPGTLGVFAIVSINKDEAADRLRTIRSILDAIGVKHKPIDHGVELEGFPIAFKVFAATIGGVSGFTSIGILLDEVAKWHDRDTGTNPATEVIRSIKPTLLTMPTAKLFMSSSPWSQLDAHFKAYEEGNTATQMVACAPTWVANPSISEQATHDEEPDETVWFREFAAIPMSAGTAAFFSSESIDRAISAEQLTPQPGDFISAGADLGFRSDSSALVITLRRAELYHVSNLVELRPSPEAPLVPSQVLGRFCSEVKASGGDHILADQHYQETVREYLTENGIGLVPAPSGQENITKTYLHCRALLNSGKLKIPKHPRLIQQLKEVLSRPTQGGGLSVYSPRKAQGGGHGDLVSALVLSTWSKAAKEVEEAPRPKFGTAEYWAWVRTGQYANEQEAEWLAKEEEKLECEQSGSEDEWPEASGAQWWDH